MSTPNIAGERLKSFVLRVERLEEEIRGLNRDKADVYAEAKSAGFDTKAMKALIAERRKNPSERAEMAELLELYRHAVGGV